MKKHFHVFAFAIFVAVALAGCASNSLTGASYVRQEARQIHAVETATVVNVRAVMIETRADGVSLGAAVGATVGAAVGNRIGSGNGRAAATVFTALLGGALGQRVGLEMTSARGIEVTYAMGSKTFAIVQQDDGTRFIPGESVRIVTGAGWNATARVAKL